jgi:hypothetical protein
MKKAVLSYALASLLLLSISASYVNMAKAQPLMIEVGVPYKPFNNPPTIQIISPNPNQTFTLPDVLLNFSVEIPHSWVFYIGLPPPSEQNPYIYGNITSVSFSLDGNQPQNLPLDMINVPYVSNSSQNLNFSEPLNLADGAHTIRIFVYGYTYYVSNPLASVIDNPQFASVPVQANTTISFNVRVSNPTIISPQNIVFIFIIPLIALIVSVFLLVLLYRRHRKTTKLKSIDLFPRHT